MGHETSGDTSNKYLMLEMCRFVLVERVKGLFACTAARVFSAIFGILRIVKITKYSYLEYVVVF